MQSTQIMFIVVAPIIHAKSEGQTLTSIRPLIHLLPMILTTHLWGILPRLKVTTLFLTIKGRAMGIHVVIIRFHQLLSKVPRAFFPCKPLRTHSRPIILPRFLRVDDPIHFLVHSSPRSHLPISLHFESHHLLTRPIHRITLFRPLSTWV